MCTVESQGERDRESEREREYAAFIQTTKQTSHRTHVDIRRYAFYSFSQMSDLFLANLSEYYVIIMKNLYGIFCNVIFLLLKKQNIRIYCALVYNTISTWNVAPPSAYSFFYSRLFHGFFVVCYCNCCCHSLWRLLWAFTDIYALVKKCDSKCIAWKVGSNGSNMMIRTKPRTYNIHYEQMCIVSKTRLQFSFFLFSRPFCCCYCWCDSPFPFLYSFAHVYH